MVSSTGCARPVGRADLPELVGPRDCERDSARSAAAGLIHVKHPRRCRGCARNLAEEGSVVPCGCATEWSGWPGGPEFAISLPLGSAPVERTHEGAPAIGPQRGRHERLACAGRLAWARLKALGDCGTPHAQPVPQCPTCAAMPNLSRSARSAPQCPICLAVPDLRRSARPAPQCPICLAVPDLYRSARPAPRSPTCAAVPDLRRGSRRVPDRQRALGGGRVTWMPRVLFRSPGGPGPLGRMRSPGGQSRGSSVATVRASNCGNWEAERGSTPQRRTTLGNAVQASRPYGATELSGRAPPSVLLLWSSHRTACFT